MAGNRRSHREWARLLGVSARQLRLQLERLVVVTLCLGLITGGPGTVGLVYAQNLDYQQARARLERYMNLIGQLRDTIDRRQFDSTALSLELAFEEPEAVIAYVKENIRFEQYPGLLRGADGTLMSRAGNTLDQAVLLQRLLEDQGLETRIVRGRLSSEQTAALIAQMRAPKPPTPAPGDLDKMRGILAELSALSGGSDALVAQLAAILEPERILSSELHGEAQKTSSELLATLRAAGVELGGDAEAELMEEARDYFWLEYRQSPSGPWIAAHPAAGDIDLVGLVGSETFSDVPVTLQHRLRIEVDIERTGLEPSTVAVLPPQEQAVAELAGVVLGYGNTPNGATEDEQTIAEVLAATSYFIPLLNGELAPAAQVFDPSGKVADADKVLSGGIGGLGQTVGGTFSGGFGLGGAEEEAAETALTAQWIDYTLIAPGGVETSYRRTILDRLGMEKRQAGVLSVTADAPAELPLIAQQRFMVATVDYPLAFLLDKVLERILATRDFLEYILAQNYGVDPEVPFDETAFGVTALEQLLTYGLFDALLAAEDTIGYRAEPSLMIFSQGLHGTPDDGSQFTSVDIVNNSRRVYKVGDDGLVLAADEALRTGVWETLVERDVVRDSGSINAAAILEQAAEAGIAIRVLAPADLSEVDTLDLDLEAKMNLLRDLELGFTVVVPEAMPDSTMTGWWRVMPTTGETLGITGDGRGQDIIEYSIGVYDKLWTAAFTVKSIQDCNGESGFARICCLAKVYMNTVFGVGAGGLLGTVGGFGFTLITGFLNVDFVGLGGQGITCDGLKGFPL